MYTIFCDTNLIHSEVEDYRLLNAKLTMEVNTAGGLEFTILPEHPNFATLLPLKPEIVVNKNSAVYWKGRIVEDTQSLDLTHNIYCEGKLNVLKDSLARPTVFGDAADTIFTALLTDHNSQVEAWQELLPGNIWTTDTYTAECTDYSNIFQRIQDMVSLLGGYLVVRYEAGGDYLDWVSGFSTVATQSINLGENILNLTDETDATELYTACIPQGMLLPNGQRAKLSYTPGLDILTNASNVAKYGLKFAPISETTWDDIGTVGSLLTRATQYLIGAGGGTRTLTISALDLANVDSDIDSFNFCEKIYVTSTEHGISGLYLLMRVEADICDPTNDRITLGTTPSTMTGNSSSQSTATENVKNGLEVIKTTMAGSKITTAVDAGTDDKGSYSGYILLGQIIDLALTYGNTAASPTITIGSVEYTIDGMPAVAKHSYSANQTYRLRKTDDTTLTFLQYPDYICEHGNDSLLWFERYASGKATFYGTKTISMTNTATFITGCYLHNGTFSFPTSWFNATPIATHVDYAQASTAVGGIFGYAVDKDGGGVQYLRNTTTDLSVDITISAIGTWK